MADVENFPVNPQNNNHNYNQLHNSNFPVNPHNNNQNQLHNSNFPVNPHNNNFVQDQPQNINFVQNRPHNNNFVQNQPHNNNFVQNRPHMNQFNQNQMQFMMNPQQQHQQSESTKKEPFENRSTLKHQNEMAEIIKKIKNEIEEKRKTGEIVIFFKYKKDFDIIPITITADKLIVEALYEYIKKSNKQNVKFKFKGKELKINDTSGKRLYELEGLVTGEEIIVEDAQ